jgi:trimeric autotransporter adhesin
MTKKPGLIATARTGLVLVLAPRVVRRHHPHRGVIAVLIAIIAFSPVLSATEHYGQVGFTGLAVPGATVTATQGDKQIVTTTDASGLYRFPDLAEGTWTVKIEMRGFAPISREITVAAGAQAAVWELALLPFEEITKGLPPPVSQSAPATAAGQSPIRAQGGRGTVNTAPSGQGFQRAGVTTPTRPPAAAAAAQPAAAEPPADANAANDGFLVNGSVNNGAASPFAQFSAFGNNRRRPGALYNAQFGVLSSNSAWDANNYSMTGQPTNVPSYYNVHLIGMFQGPLRIPRVLRNGPNLFVGYQRTMDDNATTASQRMPTSLERNGNFSETVDGLGRPVQVIDPRTGLPFPGNSIPRDRISPEANALLGYYPRATVDSPQGLNYQAPILSAIRQHSIQSRVTQVVNQRNQVFATVAYQRNSTDSTTLFRFTDVTETSASDVAVNWNRRVSQFFQMRTRYQFTQQSTSVTPHFANLTNVSGSAGVAGNNQEPINWGPPSLRFSSMAGLSDALPRDTDVLTHAGGVEGYLFRGRHNFTIGGDIRHHQINILSQQDPRGTFTFTGAATGHDFADFLLGTPSTSAIAYGNADKYFRGFSYDAYFTDDWRIGPSFTLTAGVRWEYEAPLTELRGRLVNLDIAPGFTAASPVVASDPDGALTGQSYSDSLMNTDKTGIQPRLAIAWRPIPGSSLVVRAGYGIYRNTNVYQSITTLLAQQPPLSTAFSVANSPENPLTLANGFVAPPSSVVANTFAVDPNFRIGSAHNWQASVQRDLPASLTVNATYLGTRGTHLIQEFLPNTYPVGVVNPCPTCPAGFVYLSSDGSSSRHAGQLQVRRRLRNGLTASVQYTLAKAEDDAASFQGANLSGTAFAQNWLDLDAEWGPSNFDQRHQINASVQYTTGVGVAGGALVDGWRGAMFKNWTITSQLITGSGMPLTPYYLATTPGTGYTGAIRASLTGASTDAPSGYYLNPAAYTAPAPGTWGNAGRNSARGPAQFSLNAGITRTFPWGSRINLDYRIDATNVLNRVTYSSVNTFIGSPDFGLPSFANQMRKIQTSLRVRF